MTFADLFSNDAEPLRNPDQGAGTSVLERPETKESPVRDDGGDADRFASWQAQYGDKVDYITWDIAATGIYDRRDEYYFMAPKQ